jgi:predicted phage tail protein
MKHAAAIAQLEIHASNCENNAAIQEAEGQFEDAANNRTNAADYRQAIEALQSDTSLSSTYSVRMQQSPDGKFYAAGLGLGIQSGDGQFLVAADRFAINEKPSE